MFPTEPRGRTRGAEGSEASTQHHSGDIYKLQRSPLVEEHMFLLLCAETPPRDVQAPPTLKGSIVYWSRWDCARSLSPLPFSHTQSAAGHLQCLCVCVCVRPENLGGKDRKKVSTAVQHCSESVQFNFI